MEFDIEPQERKVPAIPPKKERIRVVIDSDAKNEIDDQWAIALAILSPERFEIEGFVGANFDNRWGGPDSVDASVQEIETVLEKAGMADRWPVKHGSDPMQYQFAPAESEGVDFIIERAMASSPEDPLWVVIGRSGYCMISSRRITARALGPKSIRVCISRGLKCTSLPPREG